MSCQILLVSNLNGGGSGRTDGELMMAFTKDMKERGGDGITCSFLGTSHGGRIYCFKDSIGNLHGRFLYRFKASM